MKPATWTSTFLVVLSVSILAPTFFATTTFAQGTEPNKLWCEYPGGDGAGAAKRIVLIAGDDEYRSEESMPMLGKILSARHGFAVTVLFPVNEETGMIQPTHQTNIPGMHRIEGADLVVLGLRFRNLPDDQMKHFVDYYIAGKPIIGFRTSTHAFRYPKDSESKYKKYSFDSKTWKGGFGQQVFGDTWVSHHGDHNVESTRGVITDGKKDHPILNGVANVWGPSDVYGITHLKDSADVLMRGQILTGMNPTDKAVDDERNKPMMPLVWTQEHENESGKINKVVTTTMGAATDFESEDLRRLLVNSCYWCLDIGPPTRANVDYVDEFKPTVFGFGTERTDLKPEMFELKEK